MAMLDAYPRLRRALRVTGAIGAGLALLLLLLFGALQLDWTRDAIRRQVAAATAGSDTTIAIGEISGILPFDVALSDVRIADRAGEWLIIDHVALDWAPTALLLGTLRIDDLSATRIRVARPPEAGAPEASDDDFTLPRLPVDLDLRRARIDRLDLAAPVLGAPAALAAEAEARLGRLGEAVSAHLALRQLEGQAGEAELRLAYRPDADSLDISALVQEPRGGLLGRLLGLPQGSDLRVEAEGSGALAAWRGTAGATLDGAALFDLAAEVSGDAQRRVGFSLTATPPAALLPPELAPLLADGLAAEGAVQLDRAAGRLRIERLDASSAAGRIAATGTIAADDAIDLALTLDAPESTPFAALVPEVGWSRARVQAAFGGFLDRPRLDLQATLDDLAVPTLRVGALSLDLAADASTGLDAPIAIEAQATATQATPADARLAPLLPGDTRLALRGSATTDGVLAVDSLAVTNGAGEAAVNGRATHWGMADLAVDGSVTIADLGALQLLLGRQVQGGLDVAFGIEPGPEGARIDALGIGSAVALGIPQIDSLLGPAPQISIAAEIAGARIALDQAALTGAGITARASGALAAETIDMRLAASIDDLAALQSGATGGVTATGTLSGPAAAPVLTVQARSASLGYPGGAAEDLVLDARLENLAAPRIAASASARVDGLPATAALQGTAQGSKVDAQALDLRLGDSSLTGAVSVADGVAAGRLRLQAPDLAQLSGLAGVALGGALSADIGLGARAGAQAVDVTATGSNLAVADQVSAAQARLDARLDDLFGTPSVAARASLDRVALGGQAVDTVRLSADGTLRALRSELTAKGADMSVEAGATLARMADETRIVIDRFAGSFRDVAINSAAPAAIVLRPGSQRLDRLTLESEGGTLHATGALEDDGLEATLRAERMPMALLRVVAPDLKLAGQLDGELRVTGPRDTPTGSFDLAATELALPGIPQRGRIDARGALAGGFDVSGTADLATAGRVEFSATAPSLYGDAPLRGEAKGTLDLVLLDMLIAGGADRVRGKADLDLAVAGTLADPQAAGEATLTEGEYDNLRFGTKLRRITAQLHATGNRIEIVGLTARGPGGGRLSGSGAITLAGDTGLDLALQMSKLRALDTDLASAVIDGDLTLRGALAQRLALAGTIKVREAEIRIPDSLPPQVQEIAVVEVNLPPERQAEQAARDRAKSQTLDLDLDLAVAAPQQIAVRGRGLDAELGGALRIGGTAASPDIDGELKLRRGSLDVVGRLLEFDKGIITFQSGAEIDPLLDFTATSRTADLTVTAKVEGSARAPRIVLSSVPALPQDEILARLLFGKSVGALSPFELLELAQAAAQLSGIQSGPGLLDRIREGTGLDRLTLEQAEGAQGPSLSAGRYVGKGVYVGASQGAQGNSTSATVEIEVTPNVKVESEIGANGSGKTGVNLEWDY